MAQSRIERDDGSVIPDSIRDRHESNGNFICQSNNQGSLQVARVRSCCRRTTRYVKSTKLQLKSRISELDKITRAISAFGARHHLSGNCIQDATLALEEIFSNIVYYGFDDDTDHDIEVLLRLSRENLLLEVTDDGRPFNPLSAETPDITLPLEQRPIGGLGIFLARKLVDGLEYRRVEGKNVVAMRLELSK